jgi:hypothetical protein
MPGRQKMEDAEHEKTTRSKYNKERCVLQDAANAGHIFKSLGSKLMYVRKHRNGHL